MSSVKQEIRKFGESVSIRGVPKILKTKDRVLCTVWLCSVLGSTTVLVWLLTLLFQKYFAYPVSTTYGETKNETPTFPDVTICKLYPLSRNLNSKLTWADYIDISKNATDFYNISKSGETEPSDLREYLYKFIFHQYIQQSYAYFVNLPVIDDEFESEKCPSFIIDCTFYDIHWQPSFDANCSDFVSSFWESEYFRCYTIHLNDSMKQQVRGLTTVLYIDDFPREQSDFYAELTSSKGRGVRVAVHNPGTKPDLKRGISVGPGTETKVEIV